MLKKIILLLLGVLFLSSTSQPDRVREFHVKMVGEQNVEKFEHKFPQITSDKAVYIAYLSIYYNGHEDEYIRLMDIDN